MSQKESEWKEYIRDHHDNCAECGAQTEELISFISNLLSNLEKEIAEDVKELPWLHNDSGVKELEENVDYVEVKQVLQILKH